MFLEPFDDHIAHRIGELREQDIRAIDGVGRPATRCLELVAQWRTMGAKAKRMGNPARERKRGARPLPIRREMLLPIEGKRGAEKAAKPVRATGRKKAG